ncbi:phosphatidic acid phosphatase [Paeniglutamicibacter sp. MACA_103]|uniref:phosphatidic acid phosphatase n=1 Tax=Paeniglutamicibacter sp. MACA_103 TaxID=3377337 RepID=UPI003894B98D
MSDSPTLRPARYVTEILSPAILVSVLLLLQPLLTPETTWPQAVVAFFFVTGLPFAVLLWMKQRGKVADHHVGDRRQRAPVLVMAGISLLIGAGLLVSMDAPAGLFGAMGAVFLGLLVCLLANLVWKLSVHSAVAAYVGLELLTPVGQVGAALALALAATVGWSRIELKDHTSTQVLAGLVVGCAVYASGLALP